MLIRQYPTMELKHDDGGRMTAGFKGGVSDCVSRALSIVTGEPYAVIHAELMAIAPDIEKEGVNIYGQAFTDYMHAKGFSYILNTARVNLRDLRRGRFFCVVRKHCTAVIDGVLYDTVDAREDFLAGYWIKSADNLYNVYVGDKKLNLNPLALPQAVTMTRALHRDYRRNAYIYGL